MRLEDSCLHEKRNDVLLLYVFSSSRGGLGNPGLEALNEVQDSLVGKIFTTDIHGRCTCRASNHCHDLDLRRSFLGVSDEAGSDDRVLDDGKRGVRPVIVFQGVFSFGDLHIHCVLVHAMPWHCAGEDLEEHDAQGEYVTFHGPAISRQHLRGYPLGSADYAVVGLGTLGHGHGGHEVRVIRIRGRKAKVTDLQLRESAVTQNVHALQVSVDDSVAVQKSHAVAHLQTPAAPHGVGDTEVRARASIALLAFVEDFTKTSAGHELHDQHQLLRAISQRAE
mmetsp:Transcript_16949/g.22800  ORF Transcript_16949/g.22800 Transcript_16949/m.22800 type:complete len:279 (-) Transcript_16949:386-1222(-)